MNDGIDWWKILEVGGILGVIAALWAAVRTLVADWFQRPMQDNAAQDEEITRNRTAISETRRRLDKADERLTSLNKAIEQVRSHASVQHQQIWEAVDDRVTHREFDQMRAHMAAVHEMVQEIHSMMRNS
jgi:septal ring factor EnvC (AmiA/AmiB activator)